MHCSFVFAGNSDDSIYYHVERVRDGRSFCTRPVRAMQRGRPIFLSMISFTGGVSQEGERECLQHGARMPSNVSPPGEEAFAEQVPGVPLETPYINNSVGILGNGRPCRSEEKRIHQWMAARGPLSPSASSQTHQAALAFMSDSYFLAAMPRSHEVWDFVNPPVSEFYPSSSSKECSAPSQTHTAIQRRYLTSSDARPDNVSPVVSMMVSLDHTMYFHNT